MPVSKISRPDSGRDLITAYLLALAGLPFTLRVDAAGRPRALPAPVQPRARRTAA
jgi:hypothetical protein